MSILNIFKKKPSSVKATEGKEEKAEVGLPSASPKIKPAKKGSVRAYRVLVSPHITEKATELEKENKFPEPIKRKQPRQLRICTE